MDFRAPEPSRRPEAVLPMVNLVFLLLIFFLMVATIAPPRPVPVALPETAAADPAEPAERRVFLDASGAVHGDAGAVDGPVTGPVTVHADRDAPARRLAELLRALGPEAEVRLVVEAAR
jgi:biopolymer transport protein ExbD